MATSEVWMYRTQTLIGTDLTGFTVEAIDGKIGKVDESTNEATGSYIVVDTGPWIFGKKLLLPAGVVRDVDLDTQTIFVSRTRDEIKNAPELDENQYRSGQYKNEIGSYYGPGGRGYRDVDAS
jgi:hypothetical protein